VSCKSGHRFCNRFDVATAGAERVRMANGWALGKFGGEFGQGTADLRRRRTVAIYLVISEVGQLQSSLFLRRESRQGTS